ncbi:hypothetical protein [Salinispora vitiensis]|uniref:hypothetical protein n=1 Tax=Salinispora vitiensis TaxID=999544 RepID=UPI000374939B|nr:hypothetical protein [Salinispora vitiensis]
MQELNVITEAIYNEGGKWFKLADQAANIKRAVEGLELDDSAFFIGDANALLHSDAYRKFQSFLAGVLGGAAPEFEQIGEALRRMADEYDRADEVISLKLNQIYTAAEPEAEEAFRIE